MLFRSSISLALQLLARIVPFSPLRVGPVGERNVEVRFGSGLVLLVHQQVVGSSSV